VGKYPFGFEERKMSPRERTLLNVEPEKFIERVIAKFVEESPANRRKVNGGKYWEAPLVGFASGNDPLFKQYKTVIGDFHFAPVEIFQLTFGGKPSHELSVISWVLPAAEDVRKSNRKETKYPSLIWAHARNFGEQFNVKLRNHLVSVLKRKGYKAVAPMNSPFWKWLQSTGVGIASSWSERHAAYACGLGAFGLSDGLITAKGKAMRVGSVVTDLPLKPSEKVYSHHHANCLYYFDKSCKACASRCPAGAITEKGHDKYKCYQYLHFTVLKAKKDEYGVQIAGCGLCQTRVPCEFEIPKRIQKERGK
jgi:epoxyqueuosine reductase